MEWIKCSDKLPDKDTPVLCYDGTYIEVSEYWYDENHKHVFINPPAPPKDYITHWMPLPPPPKN